MTPPSSRRRAVPAALLAAVAAIGVAACSADPTDPDGDTTTSFDPQLGVDRTAPVSPGVLPTEGPTDLDGLDDHARGLAVGDEYVVGGNHTTLLDVRRPLPPSGGAPRPGPGREWVGARVETCFESDLDRQLEIGSYLFSAVTTDSVSYPGIQPPDAGWPVPQYPGYGRLAPGQCTSGWVAIPVPEGATVTSIVQSAITKAPVSEWSVPADAW